MIKTIVKAPVSEELIENYLSALINRFFKILPLKEAEENTLPIYIKSLQSEMLGCKVFVGEVGNDPDFLSLLSILQYLSENEDCAVQDVKREVFRAINLLERLGAKHSKGAKL